MEIKLLHSSFLLICPVILVAEIIIEMADEE
jgi:hypothetical protein